jgi:hypothetical protein
MSAGVIEHRSTMQVTNLACRYLDIYPHAV